MPVYLIFFAWAWFLLGMLAGAGLGIFFHRKEWLGGYDSWPRRLMRLGHIAFFGTGLLCLAMGLTAIALDMAGPWVDRAAGLLLIGALAMPLVCLASAWRKPFRNLFFIPVAGLTSGAGLFTFLLWETLS